MKHDLPEPTLRDREQQTRPHSVHVSHQHAPAQHSSHERTRRVLQHYRRFQSCGMWD
jgi:hypothetical protein